THPTQWVSRTSIIDYQKSRYEGQSVSAASAISGHRDAAKAIRRDVLLAGRREFVEAGGLMSYGANFPDMFRRAADIVDMILRGSKPGEIPVEQPTRFDLVINVKTAMALGLQIPDKLLALANEVIE